MKEVICLHKTIENFGCTVLCDEPMSRHTSFRIGGNVKYLIIPHSEEALLSVLRLLKEHDIACLILGNGSNVLFADEGFDGAVIRLSDGLTSLSMEDETTICCGAGVILARLCTFALENGLTGLEFAHGIPGSVGGAVFMNAGAYGGEIKDCILSVRHLSPTGEILETPASELHFSYRHTSFTENGHLVLGARFRLAKGDKTAIRERMNELIQKRKTSQPLEYPSAGSTFKRPAVGYAAAHIDECGLKGCSVGGACVSTKHAGFVINTGAATAADVRALMKKIQNTVLEQHDVLLEPEVVMLP